MSDIGRRLPHLGALPHFEAAGRLLSFTRAAAELNVTQGAVSRQIRQLEEALGTSLFRRRHRAVDLTAEGRRLHREVAMTLDQLAEAADNLRGGTVEAGVTIAATPAVASLWLIPRLDALRAAVPGAEVQVLATSLDLEAAGDRFDLGIRYGAGRWPGFAAEFLDHTDIVPVCAPGFLPGGTLAPHELPRQKLLHLDEDRWYWIDWPVWLRRHGVDGPLPPPALRADSYAVLINAAIEGQGIALGWRHLVGDHLAKGQLRIACEARLRPDHAFYLVSLAEETQSAEVRSVADWLVAGFRAGPARPAAVGGRP